MSSYTIVKAEDAHDWMAEYPGYGQLLTYTEALGAEQVAITLRRMPAGTGGKGSYGHRHKLQEEIILVIDGTLQVKVDDDELELEAGTALRLAPEALRSVHNDGPGEATLVITSVKIDDPIGDVEQVEDFWPQG